MLTLTHALLALATTDPAQPLFGIAAFTPSTDSAAVRQGGGAAPTLFLSGRQAITVTFTHAVIALGSDWASGQLPEHLNPFEITPHVAGSVRWVTTSIARFDPVADWPTDLAVSIRIKSTLRSFSGLSLDPTNNAVHRFTTPQLRMSAGLVQSALAAAATNNSWVASTAPLEPGALEFPPDASIELTFSHTVDISRVGRALTLDPPSECATIHSAQCRRPSDRCMSVSLLCNRTSTSSIPLQTGAVYRLVLPTGSLYHTDCGGTSRELSIKISGLVPFSIPFLQTEIPVTKWRAIHPAARRLRMLLRHGLHPATPLSALVPLMSLRHNATGAAMPLTLTRPSAEILLLESELNPNTTYTISLAGSEHVRDGFGLPLRPSYSTFRTAEVRPQMLTPGDASGSHFSRGMLPPLRFPTAPATQGTGNPLSAPTTWPAVVHGQGAPCRANQQRRSSCGADDVVETHFTPVPPNRHRELLAALMSDNRQPRWPHFLEDSLGRTAKADRLVLTAWSPLRNGSAEVREAQLTGMFNSGAVDQGGDRATGLLIVRHWYSETDNGRVATSRALVSAGRAAVTLLNVPDGSYLVWIIDSSTNTPIAHAAITIYSHTCWECSPSDISAVARASTDADGLATLPASALSSMRFRSRTLIAVMPTGETLVLLDLPSYGRFAMPAPRGVLISDRAVYRGGDEIFLKGYVREVTNGQLKIPSGNVKAHVAVRWQTSVSGGHIGFPVGVNEVEELMEVQYSAAHGSFSLSTRVPPTARSGEYRLALNALLSSPDTASGSAGYFVGGGWFDQGTVRTLDTISIAVADPRPPTVSLEARLGDGAQRVVPPGGTLRLFLSTSTLSGVAVGGAHVTLRWRIEGRPSPPECFYCVDLGADFDIGRPGDVTRGQSGENLPSQGEEVLEIGADGKLEVSWAPPADASRPLVLGDLLHLGFEWVGPTREVVTVSIDVPVAHSEKTLTIEAPSQAELPRVPFGQGLAVSLRERQVLGGAPVQHERVRLHLYQLTDEAGAHLEPSGFASVPASSSIVMGAELYHGAKWLVDGPAHSLPSESKDLLRGNDACELSTDSDGSGGAPLGCDLRLPTMGHFLLAACVVQAEASSKEQQLCSGVVLGRSRPQWERKPVGADYLQRALSPKLGSTTYAEGDSVTIRVHNPLKAPLSPLLAWGNILGRKTLVPPPLSPGDGTITFAIGRECVGGCHISLHLAAGADSSRVSVLGGVPHSPLLEPRAPMLASFSLSAEIPASERTVRVRLEPARDVERPGGTARLTIRLSDERSGEPLAGEIALAAVDAAILQLKAHPLVDVGARLAPSLIGGGYSVTSTYEHLASAHALATTATKLQGMLMADPFLSLSWAARPSASYDWRLSDAERPAAETLAQHQDSLTPMVFSSLGDVPPWLGGEPVMLAMDMAEDAPTAAALEMAMPAHEDDGAGMERMVARPRASAQMTFKTSTTLDESASSGGASGDQGSAVFMLDSRSDFVTTPLWRPTLQVPSSGELTLPWVLPDNVGAFELRAYAVAGSAFGVATAIQHVRRPISLVASVPRAARVGDVFACGATLTASPEVPEGSVATVTISLSDTTNASALRPIALESSSRSFKVAAGDTVEVVFPMRAVAIGRATFTLRAALGVVEPHSFQVADALELHLPVLGQQPMVTMATSRALVASARPSLWKEGISLPRAVPGSGSLCATFGVGRLPVVEAIGRSLLEKTRAHDGTVPEDATAWLAAIGAHAALVPYQASLGLTSGAAKLHVDLRAALPGAAEALRRLTDERGLHSSPLALRGEAAQASCNNRLTAFALFLLRKLALAGALVAYPSLAQLRSDWDSALRRCIQADALAAETRGQIAPDLDTLAYTRLALGSEWTPHESTNLIHTLSTARLLRSVDQLSSSAKSALALTLLLPSRPENDDPDWVRVSGALSPEAAGILQYLASCVRIRGRTAYLATAADSNLEVGATTAAYALSALASARAASTHGATLPSEITSSIDKLADGLASGASGVGALSLVAISLADYDAAVDNNAADVALVAMVGDKRVPTSAHGLVRISTGAPPPPPLIIPWSAMASPPPPFLVVSAGRGEVSFALALDFVPADLFSEPVMHGVQVERVVQLHDAAHRSATGPPLGSVPLGSIVTISVQLTTIDDLHGLEVDVWLPAGLEAIDPNADGGFSRESGGHSGSRLSSRYGSIVEGCWWWRCTSFERQTKPDRVTFTSSWVRAGTNSLSFEAVAVTRGTFTLSPVKAACVLEPEVMGLSAAGQLIVGEMSESAVPLATSVITAAAASASCTPSCGVHGRCARGVCICDPGFDGPGCNQAVKAPPTMDPVAIEDGDYIAVRCSRTRSVRVPMGNARAAPPPFAYAVPWDMELLGDGKVSLDPAGNVADSAYSGHSSDLILTIVAPRVVRSDGCMVVVLALSDDGSAFSSKSLCVCFHMEDEDAKRVVEKHGGRGAACASVTPARVGDVIPPYSIDSDGRQVGSGEWGPAIWVCLFVVLAGLAGAAVYSRGLHRDRQREGAAIIGRTLARSDAPDSPGEQWGAAPASVPSASSDMEDRQGGAGRDVELLRTTTF